MRDAKGYAMDAVTCEVACTGFRIYRIKQYGNFKFRCFSKHPHGYPKSSHTHYHIVSVVDAVETVKLCETNLEQSLLCRLPRIFTRTSVMSRVSQFTTSDMNDYFDMLSSDTRVIDKGQFVYNCQSNIAMYPLDAQAFSECADKLNMSWDDYCEFLFDRPFMVNIKTSVEFLLRKSYVYTIKRKIFIDAERYRQTVSCPLMESFIGCTPGCGGKNDNDIYLFDGKSFRWPAYYVGK